MERMRMLIVEDDAVIAADLAALLEDLGHAVCAICPDARAAVISIAEHRPDLLLLDINLGRGPDGIALAEEVNLRWRIPFLFVTSHTDAGTLARVKSVRPAGFIIKPFGIDDLRTRIELAVADFPDRAAVPHDPHGTTGGERFLFVRHNGHQVKLAVDEIHYAEADDDCVILHTARRRYALSATLSGVEERMASTSFVRIHRRYLVDIRRITALREREVSLGTVRLPIGRTHRSYLRERWMATGRQDVHVPHA